MTDRNEHDFSDLQVATLEHANPIAERLRAAIRKAGGNKAVSERSGVLLSTIGRYLAGYDMKFQSVLALAEACGVTLEWLATGKEAPSAPIPAPPAPAAPPKLFATVDMDLFGAAIDGAQAVFGAKGKVGRGRALAQVSCLLYDEGKIRIADMEEAARRADNDTVTPN